MTGLRSSRFSPHLVAPEQLERLFVGRHRLVEQLVEDVLATAAGGGSRYALVVGPRGAGKSHLLALVAARLRAHADALVVVQLAEEEYPSSLVDLLARLLAAVPDDGDPPTPAEQVANLRRLPHRDQLEAAIGLLGSRIGDRPVCLVVENLDRVFEAIGTSGQSRLRGLLHERGRWSIVASSCTWAPAFDHVKAPFHRTFHRVELPPFTDADAHAMLVRLAEAHEDDALLAQLRSDRGLSRVRTLRVLVGGSPRAMALVFAFLRSGRLDELEAVFVDLAEELTPYFQDQMSRLPPGQRPYLEHLAGSWTPLSVGEIAERTFSTPQTASGQLRYLARDHLVIATSIGRHRFYEIGEPLHRVAAAMKHPERAPAVLARFLAAWLDLHEVRAAWIERGSRADDGDPWFLAAHPPLAPRSDHDDAITVGHDLGAMRAAWEERGSPHVGLHLLGELVGSASAAADPLADELVERFGGHVFAALPGRVDRGVVERLWLAARARMERLPLVERLAALRIAVQLGRLGDLDAAGWAAGLHGADAAAVRVGLAVLAGEARRAADESAAALRRWPDHDALRAVAAHAFGRARRATEELDQLRWLTEHDAGPEARAARVFRLVEQDRPAEALEVAHGAPRALALAAAGRWEEAAAIHGTPWDAALCGIAGLRAGHRPALPVPLDVDALFVGAVWMRQLADRRSADDVRAALAPAAPDPAWVATLVGAAAFGPILDALAGRDRSWEPVADAVRDLPGAQPAGIELVDALTTFRSDPSVFLRLPAAVREAIRATLGDSPSGRALPPEPEPMR